MPRVFETVPHLQGSEWFGASRRLFMRTAEGGVTEASAKTAHFDVPSPA